MKTSQGKTAVLGGSGTTNVTLKGGIAKSGAGVEITPMRDVLDKILLKAVNKTSKKDPKVFSI